MKTLQAIDYFAPLGRHTRFEELSSKQPVLSTSSLLATSLPQPVGNKLLDFDRADRFTYMIMGLAVLIAIVVPLLNLD